MGLCPCPLQPVGRLKSVSSLRLHLSHFHGAQFLPLSGHAGTLGLTFVASVFDPGQYLCCSDMGFQRSLKHFQAGKDNSVDNRFVDALPLFADPRPLLMVGRCNGATETTPGRTALVFTSRQPNHAYNPCRR